MSATVYDTTFIVVYSFSSGFQIVEKKKPGTAQMCTNVGLIRFYFSAETSISATESSFKRF